VFLLFLGGAFGRHVDLSQQFHPSLGAAGPAGAPRLDENLADLLAPLTAALEPQLVAADADGAHVVQGERVEVVQHVAVAAVALERPVRGVAVQVARESKGV
jgi:hypothetical protein